jgi:hypothetical protein
MSWAIRCGYSSTSKLDTPLEHRASLRHASPYTSFIRRKMSLGDTPSLHRNRMTPRCTCLDASIRRTCCYNFHQYAENTCRRLTLFCAGTANSLLCTPATTWPSRQLLALLPHVSMFHLNNPYTNKQKHKWSNESLNTHKQTPAEKKPSICFQTQTYKFGNASRTLK